MGFDSSVVAGMVTSGEVNWSGFRDRSDPFWKELGSRCLVFGNGRSTEHWLEGLEDVLQPVDTAAEVIATNRE